jgi:hypothetical protein
MPGEHAAALAFDHAGRPRIAYSVPQQYLNSWEYSSGALCYMVPDGASWARTFVNSDSGYNFSPQLLLDQNDQPLILMNDPSLRLPFLATTIGVAGVAPDAGARAFALEYAGANPGRVGARHRWAIHPVAAAVSLAIYDLRAADCARAIHGVFRPGDRSSNGRPRFRHPAATSCRRASVTGGRTHCAWC